MFTLPNCCVSYYLEYLKLFRRKVVFLSRSFMVLIVIIFKSWIWEEIIIRVLLETPIEVSLETPRFSLETPIFSLETPYFHWRPHIFFGDPIFSLVTPYFHWRPPAFYWRPPCCHWRPTYFHWRPHIVIGDPQIFIWDPMKGPCLQWKGVSNSTPMMMISSQTIKSSENDVT